MNKNIFFIGGIHGVGKTTLCDYISKKYNISHFSASTLISNYKKTPFKSLFIESIGENQHILIKMITALFDKNKNYLLDGHFYLLNKNKQPEKIPKETYINLNIKKILVLTEDINIIFNRLKSRNNYIYSLSMLQDLQNKELHYSQEIASILNIPHKSINLSLIDRSHLNNELDKFFK